MVACRGPDGNEITARGGRGPGNDKDPSDEGVGWVNEGGRYWVRTSGLFGVKQTRSPPDLEYGSPHLLMGWSSLCPSVSACASRLSPSWSPSPFGGLFGPRAGS